MEYGVCVGVDLVEAVKRSGFSYFEWTVGSYLQPSEEDEEFLRARKSVAKAPLPCPAVNVFIPGSLKITGPEVSFGALTTYVETAIRRAYEAEIETIVFGSGGARRVPDGYPRQSAVEQLVQFGTMVAKTAERYGVLVAVEHLNRQECNILTSVQEAAEYVRKVDHPSFRLLVDAYHWAKENEPVESILNNGDLIIHAHIATPANRKPPGVETFDFVPFLEALKQVGYDRRLSIEARLEDIDVELIQAFEYLNRV